jgi:hypothetical protein
MLLVASRTNASCPGMRVFRSVGEQQSAALQRESRDRRKPMREIADAVLLIDDMRRKLSPQPGPSPRR